MERIQDIILERRPHVVVIGGDCRTARGLQFDLNRIIRELERDNRNAAQIQVEIMDSELATVYSTSTRAVVR